MFNMRHTLYDNVHLIVYIVQFVSDSRYLVSDSRYLVSDSRYLVSDTCYLVSNTRYLVADIRYFLINPMSEVQDLCRRHQRLLLRQSVQPLQRVFDVLPPNELLEEFL
jgi:hypothetical protein